MRCYRYCDHMFIKYGANLYSHLSSWFGDEYFCLTWNIFARCFIWAPHGWINKHQIYILAWFPCNWLCVEERMGRHHWECYILCLCVTFHYIIKGFMSNYTTIVESLFKVKTAARHRSFTSISFIIICKIVDYFASSKFKQKNKIEREYFKYFSKRITSSQIRCWWNKQNTANLIFYYDYGVCFFLLFHPCCSQ